LIRNQVLLNQGVIKKFGGYVRKGIHINKTLMKNLRVTKVAQHVEKENNIPPTLYIANRAYGGLRKFSANYQHYQI